MKDKILYGDLPKEEQDAMRRQDDRIIMRLFAAFGILLFTQVGTIASGIWWAGKFEGTTLVRLDNLERTSASTQALATNVATLNANVVNLTEVVRGLSAQVHENTRRGYHQ